MKTGYHFNLDTFQMEEAPRPITKLGKFYQDSQLDALNSALYTLVERKRKLSRDLQDTEKLIRGVNYYIGIEESKHNK